MLLEKVFEPFIEAAPICVMARGVLQRTLSPQHIDHLFTQHARHQYTNGNRSAGSEWQLPG